MCSNKEEIIVCNTLFKYDIDQNGELVVTACNTPTAVYNVGRISTRENSCNQIEYYQGFINSDPVLIIQDCSMECLVKRMIEYYFNNLESVDCNSNNCRCKNTGFGLF